MGVVQTATMRDILKEFHNGLPDNPDLCAEFSVPDTQLWVQLVSDSLNMAWPYDEAAAEQLVQSLAARLPHCQIIALDENVFVTFAIEHPASISQMADVLDWLFTAIFKMGYDYQVEGSVYSL